MNDIKLDKPGAGLPFFETLFIRHVFLPRMQRKLPWDKADDLFERETKKTLYLCKDLPRQLLAKRVLIPRIRGIEDSSRYWSINMTLEHMMIVAKGAANIIQTLAQEKPFPYAVNTADVKPQDGKHEGIAEEFTTAMAECSAMFHGIQNRRSKMTHPHPWFGPMNTNDWHVVAATHQYLHRHQIEQIIAGLHR